MWVKGKVWEYGEMERWMDNRGNPFLRLSHHTIPHSALFRVEN